MSPFNNRFSLRKTLEPLFRNFREKIRALSRTNDSPLVSCSADHAVKQESPRLDNTETLFEQVLLIWCGTEPNPCVPDLILLHSEKDDNERAGHVPLQNTVPLPLIGPAGYSAFVTGPLVIPSETITPRDVMRKNSRFEFDVRVASCTLQAWTQGECNIIRNIYTCLMRSRGAGIIRAESLPENNHILSIQYVKQRLKLLLRSHRSRFPVRLLIRSRVPASA
ncbi:hypothetical protein AZOA_39440 [Azoarcus sp. Aa7]|nr:hypothetical protein [Azoarcus sp. Aa7]